jgi:hypothetical protein
LLTKNGHLGRGGKPGGLGASGVPLFSCCGPGSVAGKRVPAHKELAMEGEEKSSGEAIYLMGVGGKSAA